ncbi:trypsin-like peptidase domain-containing protein [Modestobacter sp. URMC 112]
MTEQNRPGDQTGPDDDRTAAGAQLPPADPTPHQPTDRPAAHAANPYRAQDAPTTPVSGPAAPGATPAGPGATAHQGWPPAGWGQRPGGPGGVPPVFQPPGAPGAFPAASAPAPRRAGRWRMGVAGLVAGALIGGGAGAGVATVISDDVAGRATTVSAQDVTITNPQTATSAAAAAAKAAPSVVTVYVSSGSGSGSGSGVVLSDDGYVLTNNHVVSLDGAGQGAGVQVRTADGTLYEAGVVGTDPSSDLAVLKLQDASGLTPATFADSDEVQVGDLAVAIGAPLGLSNTVTDGIISATDRAVATGSDQEQTVIDALQTDAAINPGNSGGALVDAAGEVIGINTAIATVATQLPGQEAQGGNIGVGFAIPSNTATRIAQQIIDTGSATHALLGVSARTAAAQDSPVGTGAEVVLVQAGSPAADAGLQVGDVVTAVGDRPVTSSTELTAAVRSAQPGDEVTLTVRRGSDTNTVDVTLAAAE